MSEIRHPRARQLIQARLSLTLLQTDQESLESHLNVCAECRAYSQGMRALETSLRQELHAGGELESSPSALTVETVLIKLRAKTMRTKIRNVTGAAVAATALVLLFLLAATPQGRAWAQSLLRFFTRSESNTFPAPTEAPLVWVEQTPGVPAATPTPLPTLTGAAFSNECGDYRSPRCSIEQIRSKVNFPVKELGVIPASMHFIGATGGPDHVYILYDTQDQIGAISLTQERWTGSAAQTAWNIGPNTVVETVHIGRNPGEYVRGSFTYRAGESQVTWNENTGRQNLRWVDNGVFIVLQRFGPDGQFDRDGMVALAESLTTESVAARITPVFGTATPTPDPYDILKKFYPLTVAEAEQKAGFKLAQPSKLPAGLLLVGASFDPEQKVVLIFYWRSQDAEPTTNGLGLVEEIIPSTGACNLCDLLIIGDKTEVEKFSPGTIVGAFEPVQIGDITGQYVEGAWQGTDCCGWEWDPDPYLKRLRWQTNGMAFELSYMGMDITKEDMITIAESVK